MTPPTGKVQHITSRWSPQSPLATTTTRENDEEVKLTNKLIICYLSTTSGRQPSSSFLRLGDCVFARLLRFCKAWLPASSVHRQIKFRFQKVYRAPLILRLGSTLCKMAWDAAAKSPRNWPRIRWPFLGRPRRTSRVGKSTAWAKMLRAHPRLRLLPHSRQLQISYPLSSSRRHSLRLPRSFPCHRHVPPLPV